MVLALSGGIGDLGRALGRVSAPLTATAFVAMVCGYLLLALHLRRLSPTNLSLAAALRADLMLFGLGNLLPAGSGPLLAAAELRRDGLPTRQARMVLAFTAWFNIRTLLGLGAIAFLVGFAWQRPGLHEGLWWLLAVGVLLVLLATARLAADPATSARAARVLSRVRIGRLALPASVTPSAAGAMHAEAKAIVGTPANRALLAGLAAGSWIADAACLQIALAAAGVNPDPDVVLLAYVIGILASGIPLLPGGFGAVEAAVPAVLHHFGAPLDAALAGTLVYRGVSALTPALAGGILLLARVGGDWRSVRSGL